MREEARFRELYLTLVGEIQAFFASRGVPPHAIDDLVQSSFETFWEKRSHIVEGRAKPFLFGIAAKTLMNYRRKRHLTESRGRADLGEAPANPSALPDISAMAHENGALFSKAIAELPTVMQEVVRLLYLSGLTRAETAGRLGISRQAVEQSEARALVLLREVLEERSSDL